MPMLRWARNAGRQSDVDSPKTLVRVASIFEDVEADRTELNDFAYWVLVGSLVWGMLKDSVLSLRKKRKKMRTCVWSVFK
jgi:hypothetical protein